MDKGMIMESKDIFLNVVLKNFANFNGRARRKEFWTFTIVNIIVSILLSIFSAIPVLGLLFMLLSIVYPLAVLIPSIAVCVRRLHDTNRTGWLVLLGLIPIVGVIILIVFGIQEGTPGDNQYGPDPKKA